MSTPPKPEDIFDRAADEGRRRLDQGWTALLATGFIAGFTIVFGSAAQGLVHAAAQPHFGAFAAVLGALAFGLGVVFLVLGRAELFSENFLDPIATWVERKETRIGRRIARLWVWTLVLNLVGGGLMVLLFAVPEVLPAAAHEAIAARAEAIAGSEARAIVARSIVGGALVALLSYMTIAAGSAGTRAAVALAVGFLLALGPFEHVVVSVLHLFFGLVLGAPVPAVELLRVGTLSLAGNLVGGVGLVTLSHAAQALGERED